MKKKTIILSIILISLIVFGISMPLFNQHESSPTPLSQEPETPKFNTNEQQLEDEAQNKSPIPSATEISKEFNRLIQHTINFFSNRKTNIVAIGDSLTQGVGDMTKQGGYVGILDKHLNQDKQVVKLDNLGKKGNRTTHLLKRMEDPATRKSLENADIILITIGANDIMQVVKENFLDITYDVFSEERIYYEERLRSIFSQLTEINPDASIYLIGFYNPFQRYFEHIKELDMIVDDWNNTSEQVTESYGATFIPTKDLFLNEEIHLFADDHFHPNEKGYQLMAERILNYLIEEE